MVPASTPTLVNNRDTMEFEFHISPVPRSSRPHTSGGTAATNLTIRDA